MHSARERAAFASSIHKFPEGTGVPAEARLKDKNITIVASAVIKSICGSCIFVSSKNVNRTGTPVCTLVAGFVTLQGL